MTFTAWEFTDLSAAPVMDGLRVLNIAQDFQADIYIQRKNATTLALEPATGLTVFARWAATPTGAAIGTQSYGIDEVGGGAPGRYRAIFQTAGSPSMATDLTAYLGKAIYLIASNNLGTIADYMVTPYLVANMVSMGVAE
jgi:hypothetical protein